MPAAVFGKRDPCEDTTLVRFPVSVNAIVKEILVLFSNDSYWIQDTVVTLTDTYPATGGGNWAGEAHVRQPLSALLYKVAPKQEIMGEERRRVLYLTFNRPLKCQHKVVIHQEMVTCFYPSPFLCHIRTSKVR